VEELLDIAGEFFLPTASIEKASSDGSECMLVTGDLGDDDFFGARPTDDPDLPLALCKGEEEKEEDEDEDGDPIGELSRERSSLEDEEGDDLPELEDHSFRGDATPGDDDTVGEDTPDFFGDVTDDDEICIPFDGEDTGLPCALESSGNVSSNL
jgi:hypothetical protein